MLYDFLLLGLIVIIEIILILQIFNFTRANVEDSLRNKIAVHSSEVLTLVIVNLSVIYFSLYKYIDQVVVTFIMILSMVLIVSIWSIFRVESIRKFFGIKVGLSDPKNKVVFSNDYENNSDSENSLNKDNRSNNNSNKNNSNNNKNKSKKNKNVVFSRYINKSLANNFSFNELYPDYDDMGKKIKSSKVKDKDYSAYNGYPEGHICSGCGCMKREDGYIFCGKFVPGMGTIGCSPRWECLNCKDCKEGKTKKGSYTCDNCKCHKTSEGYICGKIDRTDGYVHKCDSDCPKCDKCYGADSYNLNSDVGMVTVDPYTSLNRVKVVNSINNLI